MATLSLEDLNQAVATALAPINEQLTSLRHDLSAVAISNKIIHAKMENGMKGRTETLTRVQK